MIILLVAILGLLFILKDLVYCRKYTVGGCEGFNMEMYDDQEPAFNPNGTTSDYYYDRNGMKGILYNNLGCSKYELPPKENLQFNYDDIIHKLEIYPNKLYDKCESQYNPNELEGNIINNNPSTTYLNFNQGVLYNQIGRIPILDHKT